jgi:hypothetical protein
MAMSTTITTHRQILVLLLASMKTTTMERVISVSIHLPTSSLSCVTLRMSSEGKHFMADSQSIYAAGVFFDGIIGNVALSRIERERNRRNLR